MHPTILGPLISSVHFVAKATATPRPAMLVTVVPLPVSTPVPGGQTPHTATPGDGLTVIIAGLVVLIAVILLGNILIRATNPQFVETDYIPWFLLHYDVAAVALILITILGLTGTINAEVISGLFAGVIGYVLGTAGRRTADGTQGAAPGSPQVVTSSPLPDAKVNGSYSQTLHASGGTPPYSWSVSSSGKPLPPGLQLDSATGLLHGILTAGGPYDFSVVVTDNVHTLGTKVFNLTVNP